jgi:lysophospholipase L1-like esterase
MPARPRDQRRLGVVAAVAVTVGVAAVVGVVPALTATHSRPAASTAADRTGGSARWQAAWRTAPQAPLATGPSHDGFTDTTIRMVVAPSATGSAVRVRLSNAYGTTSLTVGAVSVAEQQAGPVAAGAPHAITFDGQATTTIPTGTEAVSDPVSLPVRRGHKLIVSVFLPGPTGPVTWHQFAQGTNYVGASGNWTAEPGGSPYQSIASSWFFLDGVDALGPPPAGTVVAFGDSITDGRYSTLDAGNTYPEQLARRLGNRPVLNEGIGGNQLLAATPSGGDAGVLRFGRDAVEQPGVTDIVVLEGVNDIGAGATAAQLIDALSRLVQQAHARCIRIIGATITPFRNSVYDTPAHEQTREAVNAWIRTSGVFDAVADFDRALQDPADPLQLDPRYHTVGDLHPNDVGYRVMADTVAPLLIKSRRGCEHG